MMIFRKRRREHLEDAAVRRDTVEVLQSHRSSLRKVRATLKTADETLADELRRLDSAIKKSEGVGL